MDEQVLMIPHGFKVDERLPPRSRTGDLCRPIRKKNGDRGGALFRTTTKWPAFD